MSSPFSRAAAALLLAYAAVPAGAQVVLRSHFGTIEGYRLGAVVCGLGDFDGDGVPDYAVGEPKDGHSWWAFSMACVHSGADGDWLDHWDSTGGVGFSMAAMPDLNGDGLPELVVGATGTGEVEWRAAMVQVFSYGVEAPILAFSGNRLGLSREALFGASVAGLDDVDGDGTPDIAAGAPGEGSGAVLILSGALCDVFRTLTGPADAGGYGSAMAPIGDLDGDGRPEIIVGAPGRGGGPGGRGLAQVVSPGTGRVLHEFRSGLEGDGLGAAVAGGRDLDGDGTPDFAIASRGHGGKSGCDGRVQLRSGRDGSALYSHALSLVAYPGAVRVQFAGDLSGDGRPEILVGAAGTEANGGEVSFLRILSGADGSLLHTISSCDRDWAMGEGEPRRRYRQDRLGSGLGWLVRAAGIGDVDGDGLEDVLLGTPTDSHVSRDSGSAHVFSGAALRGSRAPDPPPANPRRVVSEARVPIEVEEGDARLQGIEEIEPLYFFEDDRIYEKSFWVVYHTFGEVVASVGDLDGDCIADFACGPEPNLVSTDELKLRSGRTGEVIDRLWEGQDTLEPGFRAALPMGDLDGDGVSDLAVSVTICSHWHAESGGVVRVLSGATRAPLFVLDPEEEIDQFGRSFANAGDLSGDGRSDLLIGSPDLGFHHGVPWAGLYSGKDGSLLQVWLGAAQVVDELGTAVCAGSDYDGDGIGDLAIGAPKDDFRGAWSGAVWVLSGADGAVLEILCGERAGIGFGSSLDWTADLDGDGRAELLVGAPGAGGGRAYLISSRTGQARMSWMGSHPDARFGACVRAGADFDGDGVQDLLVGAPGPEFRESAWPGEVSILSGADGSLIHRLRGPEPRREKVDRSGVFRLPGYAARPEEEEAVPRRWRLGAVIDLAGDLDGDGAPELTLGAPGWAGDPFDIYAGGRVYILPGRLLASAED